MLFKRKEKVRSSPDKSFRPPRYTSVARIRINGFEGEALLRNVSIGGFRMESRTYAALDSSERYAIQILPEAESGVKVIELEVDVRWIQSAETSFNSGFLIVKRPANRSLEKYTDYISRKKIG